MLGQLLFGSVKFRGDVKLVRNNNNNIAAVYDFKLYDRANHDGVCVDVCVYVMCVYVMCVYVMCVARVELEQPALRTVNKNST